ncbi:MAG: DUF2924 domain-containing protein, partial [Candidatus Omnitrophota bacterium]
MGDEITQKIETLKEVSLKDLQNVYISHFPDKKALPNNRTYLWRRVAYKMQEMKFGELSAKAKAKLKVLIDAYDPVNNAILKPQVAVSAFFPKR